MAWWWPETSWHINKTAYELDVIVCVCVCVYVCVCVIDPGNVTYFVLVLNLIIFTDFQLLYAEI